MDRNERIRSTVQVAGKALRPELPFAIAEVKSIVNVLKWCAVDTFYGITLNTSFSIVARAIFWMVIRIQHEKKLRVNTVYTR